MNSQLCRQGRWGLCPEGEAPWAFPPSTPPDPGGLRSLTFSARSSVAHDWWILLVYALTAFEESFWVAQPFVLGLAMDELLVGVLSRTTAVLGPAGNSRRDPGPPAVYYQVGQWTGRPPGLNPADESAPRYRPALHPLLTSHVRSDGLTWEDAMMHPTARNLWNRRPGGWLCLPLLHLDRSRARSPPWPACRCWLPGEAAVFSVQFRNANLCRGPFFNRSARSRAERRNSLATSVS